MIGNVKASIARLLKEKADPGVAVILRPGKAWVDPCYRLQWLTAEVPRGTNRYSMGFRIHVRSQDGDDLAVDMRMRRLIDALDLGNEPSLTVAPLYDYETDPKNPVLLSSNLEIERSSRGADVVDPPEDKPLLRHLVINLIVTYRR